MFLEKPIQFNILDDAVKYILFQRTQYLFFRHNRGMQWFARHLPRFIAYPLETLFTKFDSIVSIESQLRKKQVLRLFSEEMFSEYKQIEKYLPQDAHSILDIGSGVGGFNILLNTHYAPKYPKFYLLDKTEMPSKVYYGLEKKASFYNSLKIAKEFLNKNGIPKENIFIQEANEKNTIDFNSTFDLIISLVSWGFHYPVETYLDEVYEKLSPMGILIIDIRKVAGSIELLEKKFGNIKIIYDAVKHSRVVLQKNK